MIVLQHSDFTVVLVIISLVFIATGFPTALYFPCDGIVRVMQSLTSRLGDRLSRCHLFFITKILAARMEDLEANVATLWL